MKFKHLLLILITVLFSVYSNAQQPKQPTGKVKAQTTKVSKSASKKNAVKVKTQTTKVSKSASKKKAVAPIIAKIDSPKIKSPKKDTSLVIELIPSDYNIHLRSFKTNDTLPLSLFFKLGKGIGKDKSLILNFSTKGSSKNISLSTDSRVKEVTDTIKFLKSDWNILKDTIIQKSIGISIVQSAPFKGNQIFKFHIDTNKALYNLNIIAYQPINSLVSDGNAEIIDNGKLGITSAYSNGLKSSIDTLTIIVNLLNKDFDPSHNQLVFLFSDSTLNNYFKILDNPINISKSEWENAFNGKSDYQGKLKVKLNIQTKNLNDTLFEAIKHLDIILKGQTHVKKGTQRVKLSIKDNPFWVELGSNFDLLDNIKSSNFYAGIYMFDKDVTRFGDKTKQNNISFTAGVYESQAVSTSASASNGFVYQTHDTVLRNFGVVKASSTIKTIGIAFAPLLRINAGKTDANGFHWFFNFLYSELLWQTIATNFTYPSSKDTILIKKQVSSLYPFKETNKNYDFRSHYLGIGFPLYIKEDNYNLYINDVIGFTSQKYFIFNNKSNQENTLDPLSRNYINDLTFATPKTLWSPFVLLQFRLNEVSYGITFSGEIRELLLLNAKPVITLALSKKFNLDQVLKPVVSKL